MRHVFTAALIALLLSSAVEATPVTPVSYSYTGVTQPNGSYPDTGGIELIDNVVASNAYPDPAWVGFNQATNDPTPQPEVTFDLGTNYDLSSTTMTYLSHLAVQVAAPINVSISFSNDDVLYTAPQSFGGFFNSAPGTPTVFTNTVDISGNSGRYVRFQFHNNDPWLFLTEIDFESVGPVPEPASAVLLGGLMIVGGMTTRRRRR